MSSSLLLIGTDKVLPEGAFVGVLLVDGEATVPADPLLIGLVVAAAVALFCMVDVEAVCPVILALGDNEATMSTKVESRVSNDPSAIIAAIVGTGVEVMLSLQSCRKLDTSLHCSWRCCSPATEIKVVSSGAIGCGAPSSASCWLLICSTAA